jgi:thiol:disulfide interchange protein DsbD
MSKITVILLAAVVLLFGGARAQSPDPIQWTLGAGNGQVKPGGTLGLSLAAKFAPGWHLYSVTTPPGGPIPTTIKVQDNSAVEKVTVHQPQPQRKFDPNFQINVEWFESDVVFLLQVQIKSGRPAGPVDLTAEVRYQACDAKVCLQPKKKTVSTTITIGNQ